MCVWLRWHACLCPPTYARSPLFVCICVSVCVCERPTLCRLCTSCVGHVEEDVSRGQELAAGGEGGSPAVCLEAQTLGADLTHSSVFCVCVCVSVCEREREWERSFGERKKKKKKKREHEHVVQASESIKSDKHISTLTTMKTHTQGFLSVDGRPPPGVVALHSTSTRCVEFVAEQSLTPSAGIWFSSDITDGFDLRSGGVTTSHMGCFHGGTESRLWTRLTQNCGRLKLLGFLCFNWLDTLLDYFSFISIFREVLNGVSIPCPSCLRCDPAPTHLIQTIGSSSSSVDAW